MFGAKLSGCQIVHFFILVLNCPLLLSWCQIVRFVILVPNCPVPNCLVPNCPTIPNTCYDICNVSTAKQKCVCARCALYIQCCNNKQKKITNQAYEFAGEDVLVFMFLDLTG